MPIGDAIFFHPSTSESAIVSRTRRPTNRDQSTDTIVKSPFISGCCLPTTSSVGSIDKIRKIVHVFDSRNSLQHCM